MDRQPKISRSTLALALIPTIAIIVVLAIVSTRNIADDEMLSFSFINQPTYSDVWSFSNNNDNHPPGMYILDKVAYQITGSIRWMVVLPLLFWLTGTWLFVAALLPKFNTRWGVGLFSVLAFMHPEALMWGNSNRWYPYWTGIALTVFVLAILRRESGNSNLRSTPPSYFLCALFGAGIGLMFYFNYIMVIFALAFAGAWLARYKFAPESLARLALIAIISGISILPQLPPLFKVHLPYATAEKLFVPFHITLARAAFGLSVSEAVMPLSIVSFMTLGLFLIPSGLAAAGIFFSKAKVAETRGDPVVVITVFTTIIIVCALASGLAAPRNYIVLCAPIAFLLTQGFERVSSKAWQIGTTVVVSAWIGYAAHNLAWRTGTSKGSFNDHYDELMQRIVDLTDDKTSLIIAYNPNILYELNEMRIRRQSKWVICGTNPEPIHGIEAGIPEGRMDFEQVAIIESYPFKGQDDPVASLINEAKSGIAEQRISQQGLDPEYALKSSLGGKALPEYRFLITYGKVKAHDWAGFSKRVIEAAYNRANKYKQQ